jgi:hypothetical protein
LAGDARLPLDGGALRQLRSAQSSCRARRRGHLPGGRVRDDSSPCLGGVDQHGAAVPERRLGLLPEPGRQRAVVRCGNHRHVARGDHRRGCGAHRRSNVARRFTLGPARRHLRRGRVSDAHLRSREPSVDGQLSSRRHRVMDGHAVNDSAACTPRSSLASIRWPASTRSVAAFVGELRQGGYEGEIRIDYATRLSAATDNSIYQVLPAAVIFPAPYADVALALQLIDEPRFHGSRSRRGAAVRAPTVNRSRAASSWISRDTWRRFWRSISKAGS